MQIVSMFLFVFMFFVTAADQIKFPDTIEDSSCKECGNLKIPLELALRLNTITDENQLFREFIQDSQEVTGPGADDVEAPLVRAAVRPLGFSPDSVAVRFGAVADDDDPVERKALSKAKPAGCIPELRSVSLRQSQDPWIYYWPSCTRVEQCGGCCTHPLLSCQPVETETLNYQVVVTEYAANKLLYKGKEIVSVEKHTKCKCDCITKEKDCNALQEYRKGECRCVCKNKDAEAKCNADNRTMHWNSENCSCECLNVFECSTGTYFSQSTCSCEAMPEESQLYSRFGDNATIPPRRRRPVFPSYFIGDKK